MIDGLNTFRQRAKDEIEQIHKMDAVGEHHAAVVARTLEAAKMAANHVHLAELAVLHRIPQPERRRIKSQNMSDLQNSFMLLGEFRELFGFFVRERQRFFDEHVLAGLEKFLA